MKSLVVVHAEKGYAKNPDLSPEGRERSCELLDMIADEMGRYVERGHSVYFLADKSRSPDSYEIHSRMSAIMPPVIYVDNITKNQSQLLRTKEMVIERGEGEIAIAGFSYGNCVTVLHNLLLGRDTPGEAGKELFEYNAESLGWANEHFEEVFSRVLNSIIREGLTDLAAERY